VLLLDEVFANLDTELSSTVAELLTTLRTDRVIVVTSHIELPVRPDRVVALAVDG
jgi:energy-coupling factor transporter ATP-binding protein EcfA2